MFIDECVIKAKAGDGGDGAISFRREKYEPWGGPNGGDGGKGGDVVLIGDDDTNNLIDFKYKPHWNAERGEYGRGADCNGHEGKSAILKVPLGTVVINEETGEAVTEVIEDGQRIVLCKGGNGGWGNTHFKSATNRAPKRSNPGQPGEGGTYRLILKSIADVGLVGFPNAGKSSLTNLITKARSKTAPYPFTTLQPQIGVIEYPETYDRLLLADVPGLIEGASENRGLGHRFLRHIERCTLLMFLIDMAGTDERDPRDDYATLLAELKAYDPTLLKKPRLVVANKMDETASTANYAKFVRRHKIKPLPISCLTEEGIPALLRALRKGVIAHGGAPRKMARLRGATTATSAATTTATTTTASPSSAPASS
ncbi:GTPase ObgE [Opitutaceae bacterium TAV4]|nr:GTPase ObgE [Opitutaceae bacterium TAV4]RRK00683.1 GTPase ObgE [Opitutaceae bacterium TAV3]